MCQGLQSRYHALKSWFHDLVRGGNADPVLTVGSDGRLREIVPPRRDHTDALLVVTEGFLLVVSMKGGGPSVASSEAAEAPALAARTPAAAEVPAPSLATAEPTVYGPYYHTAKTKAVASQIVENLELYGQAPKNIFQSNSPAAKASTPRGLEMEGGPTPGHTVEFYTETPPNVGTLENRWVFWQIERNANLEVVMPIPPGVSLGTHPTTGEDIAILILKLAKIIQ